MLTLSAIALLATSPAASAIAETEPPPPAWSLTLEVGAYDLFLADYNGLIWYDQGPLLQTSVTLAHRSGLYLNVWHSAGFNSEWSANWDDEIDWNVGWAGPLGFAGLSADLSLGYWDCFQVGASQNDFWAVNAIVSRPFKWRGWDITPAAILQLAWPVNAEIRLPNGAATPAESGSTWGVNVRASRSLCRLVALTVSTGVFFDGGSYGYEDATICESAASLDWKLGPQLTLSLPSLRVASPITSTDRDTVWVWGVTATFRYQ